MWNIEITSKEKADTQQFKSLNECLDTVIKKMTTGQWTTDMTFLIYDDKGELYTLTEDDQQYIREKIFTKN